MKFLTVALAIISAALWFWAARIHLPHGFDTDAERHAAEKKVGYLNATAAFFSGLTAISSAFSN